MFESRGHKEQIQHAKTREEALRVLAIVKAGRFPVRYVKRCERALERRAGE